MIKEYNIPFKKTQQRFFKYLLITILGSCFGILFIRFVSLNFDLGKTIKFITLNGIFITLIIILIVSGLISTLMGLLLKRAKITITEKEISGLNIHGARKSIPLNTIIKMGNFHSNGIRAIIITSNDTKSIFIYDNTDNIDEIKLFLKELIKLNTINKQNESC